MLEYRPEHLLAGKSFPENNRIKRQHVLPQIACQGTLVAAVCSPDSARCSAEPCYLRVWLGLSTGSNSVLLSPGGS